MAAGAPRRNAQLGEVADVLRGPARGLRDGGVQAEARVSERLENAKGGGDLSLVQEVDDAVQLLSCGHDRKYLTMSMQYANQTRQDRLFSHTVTTRT